MSFPGENTDEVYSKSIADLRDTQSRYLALLKSTSISIFFADMNGRATYCNNPALQYLPPGIEIQELNLFYEFFQIENPAGNSVIQRLLSGELTVYTVDKTIKAANSLSDLKTRISLSVCRGESAAFLNFIATIEPISEAYIDRVDSQVPNIEQVLTDAPVAIGLLSGKELVISSANKALLHIWGKNSSVIGKPLLEGLPELKDQPFPELLQSVLATGEAFYGNETLAYLDRERPMEPGYYNFVYYPVRNSGQECTGVLVVVSEVTELVKAKDALAVSERRFRELIEHADVATAVYRGRELVIELANDAMLRLWGKGPEVRGKKLKEALPELDGQPFFGLLEQVFDTGQIYKATKDRADLMIDGKLESFYFNFSYKPMFDLDNQVYAILNMAVDVTENVRAAELLEESERKSRLIIEAAEIGTYELDYETGEFIFSNRLKKIFGIPEEIEASHQTLVDVIHPDDREIRAAAHELARKSGTFGYEARIIQPGGAVRWVRFTGKVRKGNDSGLTHLYGIAMDITASKQEEMRKNSFISMASHELKTPLTTIKGYLQLLSMDARKNGSDFLKGVLVKTEKQANKMIKLVNDFLDMSKIETGNFELALERVDVCSMVIEVVEEIQMITGFNQFITSYNYNGEVLADREKISQVLSNFLINAVKYADKGSIYVVVSEQNDWVTISVKDEGPGIKKEDQAKVFDKYYRVESGNNANISGFGIGLFISGEIIRMHSGRIGVEGDEGEGATFFFSLKNGSL